MHNRCVEDVEKMLLSWFPNSTLDNRPSSSYNTSEINRFQQLREVVIPMGKTDLAKRAKALNLDAIHDTVHEMARDEARHGKAFAGLLRRYFGK